LKENHFIKLKEELHLFELRSLIKTEMMTKNKKHFKKKQMMKLPSLLATMICQPKMMMPLMTMMMRMMTKTFRP
jgi:hypothetical protein